MATSSPSNLPNFAKHDLDSLPWGRPVAMSAQNSITNQTTWRDGVDREGPLAGRVARPVGRPMTPTRRFERAARAAFSRGDTEQFLKLNGTLLGAQQQGADRELALNRDEAQFQRSQMMFEAHKAAQAERDAASQVQADKAWEREVEQNTKRDADRWTKELTLAGMATGEKAMDFERMRQDREQERARAPLVSTVPVPGTGYVIPTANGHAMGTLPVQRPPGPLPAGMVPMQAQRDGVQYGRPQAGKPTVPKVQEFKTAAGGVEYREFNPETGKWRKVAFEDADGDGVPDAKQTGGAPAAGGSRPPSTFLGGI